MIRDLWFRLRALLRRKSVEAELEGELRFPLEQQVEKYAQGGMSREGQGGGRGFAKQDTASSPRVALVNETFARRFLGDTNPINQPQFPFSSRKKSAGNRE